MSAKWSTMCCCHCCWRFNLPKRGEKDSDLSALILHTTHSVASGTSWKDMYFDFFMSVSYQGKAESLILSQCWKEKRRMRSPL